MIRYRGLSTGNAGYADFEQPHVKCTCLVLVGTGCNGLGRNWGTEGREFNLPSPTEIAEFAITKAQVRGSRIAPKPDCSAVSQADRASRSSAARFVVTVSLRVWPLRWDSTVAALSPPRE